MNRKWYFILLLPFSWLYGIAVWIRNLLFDEHILHSSSVSVPTICVGNVAVGGTGKTPHVEYLIRLLSPHYKVAVLSRGYGRKTKGFILASDQDSALTIGDEPMQIHLKFPDIAVAVCADRLHGIQQLQHLCPDIQVVILDDAYQHRWLRCGFYILLTSYDNLFVDDNYLPFGRLRDCPHQSVRANAIVVTKCPDSMKPIDQRIVVNKLHALTYQSVYFSSIQYDLSLALPTKAKALLVTAIANPQYIESFLTSLHINYESLSFADHHLFTPQQIQTIEQKAEDCAIVLTTEKDAARLRLFDLSENLTRKLQVLPITIQLSDQSLFDRQVMMYVAENNLKK